MMQVERVVVALLRPISQGGDLEVIGILSERPKTGSERNPCWVASSWARKSYGPDTEGGHPKRKQHAMIVHGVHRLSGWQQPKLAGR